MNPFKQKREELQKLRNYNKRRILGDSLFHCKYCGYLTDQEEFHNAHYTCPNCNAYYPVPAMERISSIIDENTFTPLFEEITAVNVLDFPGYDKKLASLKEKTSVSESVVVGTGRIQSVPIAVGVMDTSFLMGSMGCATGERITKLVEYATANSLPLLLFCASGGARMQEGIFSLMQMAKTSAAIKQHSNKGLLYISVLTHPTTGGVTASFASLSDITLGEPKALIGFAGPRVIENTIGQKLPEGFQRAEYLEEHGFLDGIVKREDLRNSLGTLLKLHQR